jgi:hypothetical protein
MDYRLSMGFFAFFAGSRGPALGSGAEPARWMAEAGIRVDNSYSEIGVPADHSLRNSPYFGFASGTIYPYHFYEDYTRGNACLPVLEEPIICYEIGHRGSLLYAESSEKSEVYTPVDMAVKYHLTMNMFYHPLYIVRYPRCREAIEEILDYIIRIGARLVHMANDEFADWWNARSQSTIGDLECTDNTIRFKTRSEHESGMVVKTLVPESCQIDLTSDGKESACVIKKELGGTWACFYVSSGENQVEITLH